MFCVPVCGVCRTWIARCRFTKGTFVLGRCLQDMDCKDVVSPKALLCYCLCACVVFAGHGLQDVVSPEALLCYYACNDNNTKKRN